jgi:ParB/RepB/Spo0J family partition protein
MPDLLTRLRTEADNIRAAVVPGHRSVIAQLSSARGEMQRLNPFLIQVEPGFNCRDFSLPENIEHVEALALSIAQVGVKQPVTVFMKDGVPFLSDGECRWRASMLAIERGAEVATIPVMVEPKGTSELDRLAGQHIRNAGKNLTQFEKAANFKRMSDLGQTTQQIADRVGVSRGHVEQLLEMNAASPRERELVATGAVSFTAARRVRKAAGGNTEKAVAILEQGVAIAKAAGKNRATERHIAPDAPRRQSAMTQLADIFRDAPVNAFAGTMNIAIPTDAWERVRTLLGINEESP